MLALPVVEGEGSGQPYEPQLAPSTTQPKVPRSHGDVIAQTRSERASKHSYDSPLPGGNILGSDEEKLEHNDLMDFVPPTPYDSPLSGGHTPRSDEGRPNITELITICTNLLNRVLALEQSKTAQDLVIQKLKKKVKRLEKKLRARTPGMKLFKIGTSKRKSLDKENVSKQGRKSDKTKPMFKDSDFAELDMENVEEEPRRSTPAPTTQPSSKDKGKALMVEPKKPSKNPRKAHIQMDEELAIRLHKKENPELERMQRERAIQEEASNAALIAEFDNQARFLVETFAERKRFFAAQRAKQIRNKPPTKTFTYNQLKNKSLEEIQKLYEREQKWIIDFVPMDSEMVKDSRKKDDDCQKQAESSKKRPRA
ncbi:hypothetical protein Tco_1463195 [Tanacetum coccineum]